MKRKQSSKWDSVRLQRMGLPTDLTFVHLVEEARSLQLFQQQYQRPAERKHESMRAASEGGLLVKPPHLRSIPEAEDKSRHLAAALAIQFPKEEEQNSSKLRTGSRPYPLGRRSQVGKATTGTG